MTEAPWYPIAITRADGTMAQTMRRVGVSVEVWLPSRAAIVEAVVRKASRDEVALKGAAAGKFYWYERLGEAVSNRLVVYGQIAGRWAPQRWRPLVAGVWPDPLPEPWVPIIPTREPVERDGRGRPVVREPDVADVGDNGDDLAINVYAPPGAIDRREVEVRAIRGFRTMWTPGIASSGSPEGYRVAWPLYADEPQEMSSELPELPRVSATWTPTRTDLADWQEAMGCLARLPGTKRRPDLRQVFEWRACDPPYSWREIGRRLRVSQADAVVLYQAAVEALERAANRRA